MLELILVIFLCRRVKGIVEPKGYKSGIWQFYVVLAWYGLEIGGAFISVMLGGSLLVAMLSAILCAIGGSIAVQQRAKALPDLTANDKWLDGMGKQEDHF
jgi:hypothetical protein